MRLIAIQNFHPPGLPRPIRPGEVINAEPELAHQWLAQGLVQRLAEPEVASWIKRVERDSAVSGGDAGIEASHEGGKAAAIAQCQRIARCERQRALVLRAGVGQVEGTAIQKECQRQVGLGQLGGELDRLARIRLRPGKGFANALAGRELRGVLGKRARSACERQRIVRVQTDRFRIRGNLALEARCVSHRRRCF